MKMLNRLGLGYVALGMCLTTTSMNAFAQGGSALSIEEVVVTARKIEESLQDTPVAVSAFTGAELDIRGAIDITDAARAAPNVFFESSAGASGSSSTPVVFIRGIGQADFLITSDPGVGIYLDNVYVARTFGSIADLMDVERVEILRGPQGTLFGRNTIGGAINIISKKPHDELELNAEMTVGEDDWYGGRVSVNIPISDTFNARLAGFARVRDGFVDAVQYDDLQLGNDDVWGIRGQLRWEPSDTLTVDATFDFTQERETPVAMYLSTIDRDVAEPGAPIGLGSATGPEVDVRFFNGTLGPPGGGLSGDPACTTQVGQNTNTNCYGPVWNQGKFRSNARWTDQQGNFIEPENQLDTVGVSLDVQWEMPWGIDFRSITAYRAFEAESNNDLDGSPHVIFQNYNENFDNKQWSQEFQLTGQNFNEMFDWVTGVYLFHEIGEENVTLLRSLSTSVVFMLPNTFFFVDSRKPSNDSMAWFGQGTIHLMDRIHITGGLRFTDDEKRFSILVGGTPADAPQFPSPIGAGSRRLFGEQKASEWTPMVNVAVDITDDIMAYVNYSEGFRDGGFPPRLLGNPVTAPSYDPEFVGVWEGGIKSSWFENRVRANLAIFDTSYSDKQELAVPDVADPALATAGVVNLAEASLFGVEFEGNWLVTDNLRLDLALGYLDSEFDEILGGSAFSNPFTITTASSLAFTPEWTWDLGISYLWPLQNGGELFIRGDWIYSDEYWMRVETATPSSAFQDAYTKVNASMTYRHPGDQWEVVLGVQNLTDEAWSTGQFQSTVCACAQRNVSRPRSVYGTVRYSWGE